MFDSESNRIPEPSFGQQDLLASCVRIAASLTGPIGAIAGEFITQFVPRQRADRLEDFVDKLNDRLGAIEGQFKERLAASPGYAALVEQAAISAVRTASSDQRTDLAELLKHGLQRPDAEMLEEQALLSLRDRLNDAQIIILMSYGNFKRIQGDAELKEFWETHPGVFSASPPDSGSSEDDRRRWTMREHYERELESLNLLRDTEGVAKSSNRRKYVITNLGRVLLTAIGRYRDPRAQV